MAVQGCGFAMPFRLLPPVAVRILTLGYSREYYPCLKILKPENVFSQV